MGFVLVVAALASAACEGEDLPDSEAARFAGPIEGASYAVGVVTDDAATVLYVCGTSEETRPHSDWFTVDEDGVVATLDDAAPRGRVERSEVEVSGSIELPDGTTLDFALPRVTAADHGLFSAINSGCRSGVVAFEGGSAGTWCSNDGRFEQITPIRPLDESSLLVQIAADPSWRLQVDAVAAADFK
jgi:hypothetical protein